MKNRINSNAEEIMELLECSRSSAYKIIHDLNEELKSKGYRTRSGRVNREYFYERYAYKKEVV